MYLHPPFLKPLSTFMLQGLLLGISYVILLNAQNNVVRQIIIFPFQRIGIYDTATPLWSIDPTEFKAGTQTGIFAPMFTQHYSQEPKGESNPGINE